VKALCGAVGAQCLLSYGALLGAVRDGGVLPWSGDVDFAVDEAEIERLLSPLAKQAFAAAGFRIFPDECCTMENGKPGLLRACVDIRNPAAAPFLATLDAAKRYQDQEPYADISNLAWSTSKGGARQYRIRADPCFWPEAAGFPASTAQLDGEPFLTFRDQEHHLRVLYGDWKTPVEARHGGAVIGCEDPDSYVPSLSSTTDLSGSTGDWWKMGISDLRFAQEISLACLAGSILLSVHLFRKRFSGRSAQRYEPVPLVDNNHL
jgi:hypothetical protein